MRLAAFCIIFCIILLGYIAWINSALKVNIFLTPCITVTGITAVVYMAGLLNVMTAAFYGISIAGLVLFVRYFFRVRWLEILKKEYFSFFLLALVFAYVIYYLKGAVYGDGDTMTHWALIAREMCETNRLPNFTTNVVTYQSYPPATACWIWFAAQFTGFGEAKSMLAQAGWLFTLALSVFSLNRNNRKSYSLAAGLFVLFIMFFDAGIDNLRVDTILPAAFIAGAALCFSEQENENLLPLLTPFLICITTIKNSGILFAGYLAVIVFFLPAAEKKSLKTRFMRLVYSVGVPVGAFYLWKKHTDMVFAAPGNTRHSMSVSAMQNILGDRTAEDIKEILSAFLKRWFSLNESAEWAAFLVFFIVFLLALGVCRKKALFTFTGVLAGYAIYKVMLLAMYLVNLPGEEAKNIPAYARYQGTYSAIVIFAAMYLLALVTEQCQGVRSAAAAAAAVCAFAILGVSANFPAMAARPNYETWGCHRKLVALVRNEEDLEVGQQVLVYTKTPYAWYYVRYTFHNQGSWGSNDVEKLKEALSGNSEGFERIVIMDHDENVDQVLAEFGYENSAGTVIIKL